MTVIYQNDIKEVHYEVRTAGNSIRLYTNGAFHSQHNPRHLFTGAVWDLLALPALCADTPARKVLALGVGGGTVVHQLDRLENLKSVTGIELDPEHIKIARRFFGLKYDHTKLIEADARSWLKQSRAKFDYIIDDVFLHGEVDPDRPFYPDDDWCRLLAEHLSPGGAVVQNHIDDRNARQGIRTFHKQFDQVMTFSTSMYGNTVVAGYLTTMDKKSLKKRCADKLADLPRSETNRLRHRIGA